MKDISYEKLVELVTQEVMKSLKINKDTVADLSSDMRPRALVLGPTDSLPMFAVKSFRISTIDDYDGDISDYGRIFITSLSCTQLSNIASARNDGKMECAVINGLLNGKKIFLVESAIEHRKFKSTAKRNFYLMLEGYVHTLQSFGIEIIKEQWYGKNLDRSSIADNTVDKVITEKIAKSLISDDRSVITLRSGTVITPSAKDVFNHSDKKVEFVD